MALLKLEHVSKKRGNSTLFPPIHMQIDLGQCSVIQCNSELGNLLIHMVIGQIPASEGVVTFQGNVAE